MFHVKHFEFYESYSGPLLPVLLSHALSQIEGAAMFLYSWLRVDCAINLGLNEITY